MPSRKRYSKPAYRAYPINPLRTILRKRRPANAEHGKAPKPHPYIPSLHELAPKYRGLALLQGAISQMHGRARLLPYEIINSPEQVNTALLRKWNVPARILVRSDLPAPQGIPLNLWRDLPRETFSVNKQNIAETALKLRRYMADTLQHKYPGRQLFFILHPLRPKGDYHVVGRVLPDSRGNAAPVIEFGPPEVFSTGPDHQIFRQHYNSNKLGGMKGSDLLQRNANELMEMLQKFGVSNFEASFVTYKDAPDIPEFYDLRIGSEYHRL